MAKVKDIFGIIRTMGQGGASSSAVQYPIPVGPGIGGGTSSIDPLIIDVVDVTYNEFSDLYDSSTLSAGVRYKITDYRTGWLYSYDQSVLGLGDVEPILVLATGPSAYANDVYSTIPANLTDSIKRTHAYDSTFNNGFCEGDWIGGVVNNYNSANPYQIISVGTGTMVVEGVMPVGDTFVDFYIEDTTAQVWYFSGNADTLTDLVFTDLGGGQFQIDVIGLSSPDGEVFGNTGDLAYIYMGVSTVTYRSTGRIYYRQHLNGFTADCDFRAIRQRFHKTVVYFNSTVVFNDYRFINTNLDGYSNTTGAPVSAFGYETVNIGIDANDYEDRLQFNALGCLGTTISNPGHNNFSSPFRGCFATSSLYYSSITNAENVGFGATLNCSITSGLESHFFGGLQQSTISGACNGNFIPQLVFDLNVGNGCSFNRNNVRFSINGLTITDSGSLQDNCIKVIYRTTINGTNFYRNTVANDFANNTITGGSCYDNYFSKFQDNTDVILELMNGNNPIQFYGNKNFTSTIKNSDNIDVNNSTGKTFINNNDGCVYGAVTFLNGIMQNNTNIGLNSATVKTMNSVSSASFINMSGYINVLQSSVLTGTSSYGMFIYASINDCTIGDQQSVYYYVPVVNKTIPTLALTTIDTTGVGTYGNVSHNGSSLQYNVLIP